MERLLILIINMTTNQIKQFKKKIINSSFLAKEGHLGSAFSVLDILWVLYNEIMRLEIDKKDSSCDDKDFDRFVLSKGHASLALYAVLAEKGYFSWEELLNFCQFNSSLGGHPDCNKVSGVEASTGSLGHGFPMAVGLALGAKINKNKGRVFCLVGDGECNEGTIWESALLSAHHKLSNLCLIVDFNHSTDRALRLGDLANKFRSFDWAVTSIDGHNHQEIYTALKENDSNRPRAIIAETIKGHGIKTMENEPAWHHRSPTESEMISMVKELM